MVLGGCFLGSVVVLFYLLGLGFFLGVVMAAFRKIVARRGFEDALSGVVRSGGLIVVDWPDDAVGVVVDSWLDDLVFRDDLTVDVDSVEFYPIEKMVDGLFEVVGWQFCADGHVLFDSFRDEDED